MNVRCTRCRAVYSLEDVIYGGGGGDFKPLPASLQVECGRCDYVFEAPVPGKNGPRISHPRLTPVPKAPDALKISSSDRVAKALKPRRPVEADSDKPIKPPRAAPAPAEEEGEFERSQRERQLLTRRIMLGIGALAAVAVIVLGGVLLKRKLTGGLPGEARAKVERARVKLLLDDEGSLADAVRLYREATKLAPGEAQPEADFAFASLLLSESHREQADRLEALAKAETDKLPRLAAEKPAGWEAQSSAIVARVGRLAAERDPHVAESQRLLREGHAAFTVAADEEPDDPSVVRAQALYWAIFDADKGRPYLAAVEARAAKDPLALYVKAAAALSGGRSREKQDRALSALAEVQQAEPRFLRALYDRASIAAERQQYGPARADLQALLSKNAQHERAKFLLELLPGTTDH